MLAGTAAMNRAIVDFGLTVLVARKVDDIMDWITPMAIDDFNVAQTLRILFVLNA